MVKWNYENFMAASTKDAFTHIAKTLNIPIKNLISPPHIRSRKGRSRIWAIIVAKAMGYIDQKRAMELIYEDTGFHNQVYHTTMAHIKFGEDKK